MPWRTVRGNVELLAELHGLPREERRRAGPAGHRPRRPHRVRGPLPEVVVGRDADALLAGPDVDAAATDHAVRRAVRRGRRDHQGTAQRGDAAPVRRPAVRRPVHHPLDLRSGVPQHSGARDVAAARSHRRRDRGAVPLPTRSRPALRPRSSRRSAPRCPTPCGPAGHERPGPDRHGWRQRRSSSRRRWCAPTARRPCCSGPLPPSCRRSSCSRLVDRRVVLRVLRRARPAPPVPPAPTARGRPRGVPRPRQLRRDPRRAVVEHARRGGRPRGLDRARRRHRRGDEPGQGDRAGVVPVPRDAAGDSDPRPRPDDPVLVRHGLAGPRARLRDHLVLPDRPQHVVRAAVGRSPGCTT